MGALFLHEAATASWHDGKLGDFHAEPLQRGTQ